MTVEKVKNFFVIYETRKVPVEQADSDVTINKLISSFMRKIELPTTDEFGNAVRYRMRLHRTGQILAGRSSLARAGIREGDELEVISDILVGKKPSPRETPEEVFAAVNFSAPIMIPKPMSLAVNLVPSDIVYQLEEYRSDQMRWEAVMWAFLGAIFGIIANWVTADPIATSRTSLILLVVFTIMTSITWFAVKDYKSRAERMKKRLLSFKDSSETS